MIYNVQLIYAKSASYITLMASEPSVFKTTISLSLIDIINKS